jgi:hypothetical protein
VGGAFGGGARGVQWGSFQLLASSSRTGALRARSRFLAALGMTARKAKAKAKARARAKAKARARAKAKAGVLPLRYARGSGWRDLLE